MVRIYIAGPMRNIPQCNFPAFDAARTLAREKGFKPISPADMDRDAGINPAPDFPCTGSELSQDQLDDIIQRDIDAIMALRPEKGDGIALLPNWQISTGTRAEVGLALFRRLQIRSAVTFFPITVKLVGYVPLEFIPHSEAACLRSPEGGLVREPGIVRAGRALANGEI